MTIEQKAREIAERVEEEHGSYWGLPEAARLGIIEGRRQAFEEAAEVADDWSDSPIGYRIAKDIRALIEEQKL